MPDTRTWDAGGSDGTWSTAVNWSDDTSPIDGDDVLFNDTADVAVTVPDSAAGFAPALFFAGDDYTKDIGTGDGNRLEMNAVKMIHRGKGTIWLKHTSQTTEIIVNHSGSLRNRALELDGTFDSIPLRLIVSRGRVLDDINSVAFRDLVSVSGRQSELHVTPTNFRTRMLAVVDGNMTIKATSVVADDIFVSDGILTIDDPNLGALARVVIANNGLVIANTSVVIGTAYIIDGVLDFTQVAIKRTITNVNIWPNGKFKYFPDLTTITNPINEFDGRSVAP